MNKIIMLIIISFSLSGCAVAGVALMPIWVPAWGIAGYNQMKFREKNMKEMGIEPHINQAPPPLGKLGWRMLECGFSDIYGTGMTENEWLESSFCVERTGLNPPGLPDEKVCQKKAKENYPACRPGAVIPVPSIARRLNSPYCKDKVNKNKPECQP